MRGPLLSLFGAWVLLGLPMTARAADVLTEAREQMRGLRFDDASTRLKKHLLDGGLEAEGVVSTFFLWAEAEASMGREAYASELFGRALELEPSRLLPPDASPRLIRAFNRARSRLQGRALQAQVRSDWLSDGRTRTQLSLRDDVFGLVRAAVLKAGEKGPVRFSQVPDGEALWVCAAPPCVYSVELLDESGNVLRRLGGAQAPLTVDRQVLPAASPSPVAHGGLRRAWPFLAGSAALGLAAGVLAWQFAQAQATMVRATDNRPQYRYAEVQALDRHRRTLQIATLATSAGAVAAGVGTWLSW